MNKFRKLLPIIISVLLITISFSGCHWRYAGARFFDDNIISDDIKEGIYAMTEESYDDYKTQKISTKGQNPLFSRLTATVKRSGAIIRNDDGDIVYQTSSLDRHDDSKYYRTQTQFIKVWMDFQFVGDTLNVRYYSTALKRDYQFILDSEIEAINIAFIESWIDNKGGGENVLEIVRSQSEINHIFNEKLNCKEITDEFIYSEEFFAEKALVIYHFQASHKGSHISINSLKIINDELIMTIGFSEGDAMAISHWLIILEVTKTDVEGLTSIRSDIGVFQPNY